MSAVTDEMILEYIRKKGGRVKNVDLVKHFRKHLLFEDKQQKELAREAFKETVNSIAVIRQEEGEKFLYLKDNLVSEGWSHASPSPSHVRTPLQSVQQSPNRVPQPHPSTPPRVSQPVGTPYSPPVRPPLSNNLGRPTELSTNSSSRPTLDLSSSTNSISSSVGTNNSTRAAVSSYKLHNGISEVPKPPAQERVVSQKHKSPVPLPTVKRTGDNNIIPVNHYPSTSPRHTSSQYQTNHESNTSGGGFKTVHSSIPLSSASSPRVLSPPLSSIGGSPRIMSPPRTTTTRTNEGERVASTPNQSNGVRHPRPTTSSHLLQTSSSSSSFPVNYNRYSQPPQQSSYSTPLSIGSTPPQPMTVGRSTGKKTPAISGPMNVTSTSSNGGLLPNSSLLSSDTSHLLQHFTSELENFGSTGLFSSSPPVDMSLMGSAGGEHVPHQMTSSENSSLSSISAHSTSSPPPVDTSSAHNLSTSLAVTRPTNSRGGGAQDTGGGVQKLIQQYTVPPGMVVPSSPPPDKSLVTNKVGRSASSVSSQSGGTSLRREPTPPEVRVQRSHSNVGNVHIRKSRLIERNSNLDTLTRQSIKGMHKMSHRLSRNSDELASMSREDILSSEELDRDSPVNERDEDFVIEMDPLEREWLNALIDGDMASLHRILMTDSSYINKKDFLNGWTALHWAAKLEREEMISALVLTGAKVDIKSNGGLTPLHLAAECGHENVVRFLVYDHNASASIRDHSGRRPLDMLPPLASEGMKRILKSEIRGYPGFKNASLSIAMGVGIGAGIGPGNSFNIPRTVTQSSSTLRKHWSSTGHLADKEFTEKRYHPVVSPKGARKGFSFRRKKYQVQTREKKPSTQQSEYYHDRYNS